jgi:hypothetical protein
VEISGTRSSVEVLASEWTAPGVYMELGVAIDLVVSTWKEPRTGPRRKSVTPPSPHGVESDSVRRPMNHAKTGKFLVAATL